MDKKAKVIQINKTRKVANSKPSYEELLKEVKRLQAKQKEIYEISARAVLRALDEKDHYTHGHSMRVAYFSLVMGKELGLSNDLIYELELAALFHDIGKIGIPDKILTKPERLTEEEFKIMKEHPVKSGMLLKDFGPFEKISKAVRHHHERYDGRGYPDNLKGENIPLFARIILIADTFDAMTSSRPYRKGLAHEIAFKELQEFSGTQFDKKLVDHFIKGMLKEEEKQEKTFTLTIIHGEISKIAA